MVGYEVKTALKKKLIKKPISERNIEQCRYGLTETKRRLTVMKMKHGVINELAYFFADEEFLLK